MLVFEMVVSVETYKIVRIKYASSLAARTAPLTMALGEIDECHCWRGLSCIWAAMITTPARHTKLRIMAQTSQVHQSLASFQYLEYHGRGRLSRAPCCKSVAPTWGPMTAADG